MTPNVFLQAMSKILGKSSSLISIQQQIKKMENSEFRIAILRLEIDLVSHPESDGGIE